MTQTEHLMAGIVTHSHDIEALLSFAGKHLIRGQREDHDKAIGVVHTLMAERDIKRDTLSKLCKGWFE